MIKDIIIILVIIVVLFFVVKHYINALSKDLEEEEVIPKYSLENLTEIVQEAFSNRLKENLKELNLSSEQLASERRKKIDLRKNLHDSSFGDSAAKRYVKDAIKAVLQDKSVGIDYETINIPIPFNQPNALTIRQKTDIVLHIYEKNYQEVGFEKMMYDYQFLAPKNVSIEEECAGKLKYVVTKEDMSNACDDLMTKYPLSFDDKFEIVAQYIFAQTYGLGVVDQLLEFSLDEVQGGTGGVAQGKIEKENIREDFQYSFEDVRVIFKGIKYKMACMSFESNDELIRIVKNIYKYQSKRALTQSEGHTTEMMRDGSRVSVSRPPESAGYGFFVRKFDSVSQNPTFEELYKNLHCIEIPKTILKHIVHTQRSFVITGIMSTGKSTLLRVVISYIPSEKAIRTLELNFELNLPAYFPQRGIFPFAVTETTSMQDLYDFIKKTSSDVNIIGEAASHIESVIALQSTQVGSEMAITTNHSLTTDDFIINTSDALMSVAGYTDSIAAQKVVVAGYKFDIHLAIYNGIRYIERITEIVPIDEARYPSEIARDTYKDGDKIIETAGPEDKLEYWKRQTDRKAYRCVNIVEFDLADMSYHMKNAISPKLKQAMLSKLDGAQREEFINDMNILESMIGR